MKSYNFCIIGSGIAGMSASLRLADHGSVCIITKGPLISGSTPLAQGGISAVTDVKNDSFESHFQDTLNAGRNTNNKKSVKILVESGPEIIKDLQNWGVKFAPNQHLEGGHSFPRIWNAKDRTGNNIAQTLAKNVLKNKNITIEENSAAFHCNPSENIISSQNFSTNTTFQIQYNFLIIATGGYSSLYAASTSPPGNTGDAIAMAMNAGIETKELSKIQFHPTVLKKKRFPRLLLTEAIRGAGGKIVNENNQEIIDPLLPRDIVSKAVWESEKNGENIFLDGRHIEKFHSQFPFITNILLTEFQIDPLKELIPITFGAHYCMGGIETDIFGKTNINNIYAIGECANNGVHGNNRLASNSLLEGLVFAKQAVQNICSTKNRINNSLQNKPKNTSPIFISSDKPKEEQFFITIQNTLYLYISIERTKKNIMKAENIFNTMSPFSTREQNALTIAKAIVADCKKEITE